MPCSPQFAGGGKTETKVSTFTGAHYKVLTTAEDNYHWEASYAPTEVLEDGLLFGSKYTYFKGLYLTTRESVGGKNIRVVVDASCDITNSSFKCELRLPDDDLQTGGTQGAWQVGWIRDSNHDYDNELPAFISLGKVDGRIQLFFLDNHNTEYYRYGRLTLHSITVTEGEVDDPVFSGPTVGEDPYEVTLCEATEGAKVSWQIWPDGIDHEEGSWTTSATNNSKTFQITATSWLTAYAEKDGLQSRNVEGSYHRSLQRHITFNHSQPYRTFDRHEDLSTVAVYCNDIKPGEHLMAYDWDKAEAVEVTPGESVNLKYISPHSLPSYYWMVFFVKDNYGNESDEVYVKQQYDTPEFNVGGLRRDGDRNKNIPVYLSFYTFMPDNAQVTYRIVKVHDDGTETPIASGTWHEGDKERLITESCRVYGEATYTVNGRQETLYSQADLKIELEPVPFGVDRGISYDLYDAHRSTTGYSLTLAPDYSTKSHVWYTTDGSDPMNSPTARLVEPYQPWTETSPGTWEAQLEGPVLLTGSTTVKARILHDEAGFWEPMAEYSVNLGINPDFHYEEPYTVVSLDPEQKQDVDHIRYVNRDVIDTKSLFHEVKGEGLYGADGWSTLTGRTGENYVTMMAFPIGSYVGHYYSTRVVTVLPKFNAHEQMVSGAEGAHTFTLAMQGGAAVKEETVDGVVRKYIDMPAGSSLSLTAPKGRFSGIFLYGANDSTNVNAFHSAAEENTYQGYLAPVPFNKYYYKWIGTDTEVTLVADAPQRVYSVDAYLLMEPNGIEIAGGDNAFYAYLGQDFTEPAIVNPHGLPLCFASSDETVAKVNETTGEVTLVAKGACRITITYDGEGGYAPAELHYDLTVIDLNDTKGDYTFVFEDYADDIYSSKIDGTGEIIAYSTLYDQKEIGLNLMFVSSESNVGKYDGKQLGLKPGAKFEISTYRYDIKRVELILASGATLDGSVVYEPATSYSGATVEEGTMTQPLVWEGSAQSVRLAYNGTDPLPVVAVNVVYDLTTIDFTEDFYFDAPDIQKFYSNEGGMARFHLNSNLTAGAWNAFSSPVDIPAATLQAADADVEVMAFESSTDKEVNFAKHLGTLHAGTPYLVKPTKDIATIDAVGEVRMMNLMPYDSTLGEEGHVQFVPSVMMTMLSTDGREFVLGPDQKFELPSSPSGTLRAMSAFFRTSDVADLPNISVSFSHTPSGINAPERLSPASTAVYNLQGQRVEKPGKGLYIVGGRKVVVK